MVLDIALKMGLNMVLNMVSNMILNTVLNMILNMVSNVCLSMVLNMVLNTSSSLSTNLISMKQLISLRLTLDYTLVSSFIRVNVSNSNKISEYSSRETASSDNALEMRLLIVLSDKTANIAIYSYFSIFNESISVPGFSTTRSNPITFDTAFIQIAAGAATIDERRPASAIPL